ncbi:MAG: TonB-dependent receptor, partial [Gammaproteobacteria bacterium]|nr:TonB-dependent receptor [Gammaproteobacteria bacterium]
NMLLDINDNLTLSGAIKNLFDQTYFGIARRFEVIGGIPERGRELTLSIHWRF